MAPKYQLLGRKHPRIPFEWGSSEDLSSVENKLANRRWKSDEGINYIKRPLEEMAIVLRGLREDDEVFLQPYQEFLRNRFTMNNAQRYEMLLRSVSNGTISSKDYTEWLFSPTTSSFAEEYPDLENEELDLVENSDTDEDSAVSSDTDVSLPEIPYGNSIDVDVAPRGIRRPATPYPLEIPNDDEYDSEATPTGLSPRKRTRISLTDTFNELSLQENASSEALAMESVGFLDHDDSINLISLSRTNIDADENKENEGPARVRFALEDSPNESGNKPEEIEDDDDDNDDEA